jgi:ATP-dependent Lon protease
MPESSSNPESTSSSSPESGTLLSAVLPLRDIVVFPHMIVPLFVGREKSVRALEEVMTEEKQILLLTQKNAGEDDPAPDALYRVGTLATVLQLLKLPDQTVRVLVEGKARARVKSFSPRTDFFQALIEPIAEQPGGAQEIEALVRSVKTNFESYIKLNKKVPAETLASVAQIEDAAKLADTVASHLTVKIPDRQQLLETLNTVERLERVLALIEGEIGVLQVERKIRSRVKRQMEKTQREYYLNEQLKAIQKELGEGEEGRDELAELEERIKKTKLSKEAREKAQAEVKKLRSMSPMSAEATVVRNYLDWMLSLPWGKKSKIKKDIGLAEAVLHEDHYGLDKVKERILEYLAVQSRAGKMKGPILCLVGPPGVGKTSLGKSIARATGREFVRMSLGGVRDEAEIRGHRRTYIGSMPGKIVQSMKKAKTANPLFLLDEIDKLGADWRGDPSAALLEVLDPEQNHAFNDHYLEVDFDLSDVMFITTANTLRMPQPLMDRMEIIRIPGYTEDEKVEIAKRHLLPKQIKSHGLKDNEWSINDDGLRDLIRYYTREAGVRNLERELANLARKAVKAIVSGKQQTIEVTPANLGEYAGVRKFRYGEMEGEDQVGVVTGLAWTEVGGETLTIESVMVPGKGRFQATGKLGDVMKEIDRRRALICAVAGDHLRDQAAAVRPQGHSRSRAGGGDPEGWPVGRCGNGDIHHLGAHGHSGSPRCGDDRRNHSARPGSPDRRIEGKAARGPSDGSKDRGHSFRKREGSRGHTGQREERARDRPGGQHGGGSQDRPRACSHPGSVGGTRRAGPFTPG